MTKQEVIEWLRQYNHNTEAEAVENGAEVVKWDAESKTLFFVLSDSDLSKIDLEGGWYRAGGRNHYSRERLPRVDSEADCIGIELETERECGENAAIVSNLFGATEDASLNNGFELVFRAIPVTTSGIYYFIASILNRLAALLSVAGFKSWNGGRCGLHLHRSLSAQARHPRYQPEPRRVLPGPRGLQPVLRCRSRHRGPLHGRDQ